MSSSESILSQIHEAYCNINYQYEFCIAERQYVVAGSLWIRGISCVGTILCATQFFNVDGGQLIVASITILQILVLIETFALPQQEYIAICADLEEKYCEYASVVKECYRGFYLTSDLTHEDVLKILKNVDAKIVRLTRKHGRIGSVYSCLSRRTAERNADRVIKQFTNSLVPWPSK